MTALSDLGPWRPGTRVALGCSGGADSTFLAHAWAAFAHGRDLTARALVVDHQQRPESAGDAERAAAAAELLGIEAAVLVALPEGGDENSLRQARYSTLEQAMREAGETVLLLGHHADDQAETVLLRILRGTGLRGLAGMASRRLLAPGLEIRRPLLGLRAAGIRDWLRAEAVDWLEDPSNHQRAAAARNRLRLDALPALASVQAGDPVRGLLHLAAEARDWEAARADLLAEGRAWTELPSYLRRQEIQDWLQQSGEKVSPARTRDLERALLARGRAGVRSGLELRLEAGRIPERGLGEESGPDPWPRRRSK